MKSSRIQVAKNTWLITCDDYFRAVKLTRRGYFANDWAPGFPAPDADDIARSWKFGRRLWCRCDASGCIINNLRTYAQEHR